MIRKTKLRCMPKSIVYRCATEDSYYTKRGYESMYSRRVSSWRFLPVALRVADSQVKKKTSR